MTSLFAAVQNVKKRIFSYKHNGILTDFPRFFFSATYSPSHAIPALSLISTSCWMSGRLLVKSTKICTQQWIAGFFSWLRFQDWDEIIERHRKIGLRHPHTIAFPGPKNPLTLSKTLLNWDHVPSCWDGNFSHRTSILQGGKAHSLLSSNKS